MAVLYDIYTIAFFVSLMNYKVHRIFPWAQLGRSFLSLWTGAYYSKKDLVKCCNLIMETKCSLDHSCPRGKLYLQGFNYINAARALILEKLAILIELSR
jgi:hypothetical protein